jgi:predicted nucleic acid-binding protein
MVLDRFFDLNLPILGHTPDSVRSLTLAAIELANRLGTSYYDGIFLALADMLGTQLITADDKVTRNLQGRTPLLLPLGQFALPSAER